MTHEQKDQIAVICRELYKQSCDPALRGFGQIIASRRLQSIRDVLAILGYEVLEGRSLNNYQFAIRKIRQRV